MEDSSPFRSWILSLLTGLLGIGVFIFDIMIPLGVATGVLYVVAIAMTIWARQLYASLIYAFVFTLLTIIGWIVSAPESRADFVAMNRLFSIVGIWAIGLAIYRLRRAKRLLRSETEVLQKTTEELKSTKDELLESNEVLAQFNHSVSHDLQAPVRAMQSFSEKVHKEYSDKIDDQGKRWLGFIQENAKKMGEIISSLLNISRVDKTTLNYAECNIKDICETHLENLREVYPNIKPEVEITGKPALVADKQLVDIAVQNLLDNAFKYRHPDRKLVINIHLESVKDGVNFIFKDNGIGFEMKHSEQIFEPFERLHSESDYPGSGLGLATVKRIVNRHGGSVYVKSIPGQGSLFTLKFPELKLN